MITKKLQDGYRKVLFFDRGITMKAKDIMLTHLFPDFVLIGGSNGLDNEIKRIAVFDAPDMSYWLQGSEFIIGNGFIFKDDNINLSSFLSSVKEKNVACVGIKFDRFTAFMDMAEIAKIANELKLPVFRIPFRYRWLEIIEKTMFEINRTSLKNPSYDRDSSFLKEFDSIGVMLQEIANRIGRTIFFSSHGEKEGIAFNREDETQSELINIVNKFWKGEITDTELLPGIHGLMGIRKEIRNISGKKITSKVYFTQTAPFFELNVLYKDTNDELTATDEKILTRGTVALKTLMTEQVHLYSIQHHEIAQTLERLVMGSYSDPELLLKTLRKWDLLDPIPCRIATIRKEDLGSDLIGTEDIPYRFSCSIGNYHVLLIPWDVELGSDNNERAMNHLSKYKTKVALGAIASSVKEIPNSYKSSLRVLEFLNKGLLKEDIALYENVILELALGKLLKTEEANDLWFRYWEKLSSREMNYVIDLKHFLSVLTDCGFNLSDCSKELNIHYNTARKYADAVEETLNISLKDFRTQFCVFIAKNKDEAKNS